MRRSLNIARYVLFIISLISAATASAGEVTLEALVEEALQNSPEIKAAEARTAASRFRIPQATSLPDPMFMVGYQNEGFSRFNYGQSEDAQVMFSASQMIPFPGKRGIKGEMAERDSEAVAASYDAMKHKTVQRIRELYHDLFLAHKTIDLLHEKTALFSRIEDAALARYAAGNGMQQEVLMAQTEKYMLLEREEMQRQKVQSIEAMLNATLGRETYAPLGRPAEPKPSAGGRTLEELVQAAYAHSPEVRARERMAAAAEAKVRMARREYYPDFTVTANYGMRGGGMMDMWSLTTAVNIPIFYRSKQRQGVAEAEASQAEARREVEAARLMVASGIRDNYSMAGTAGRLMSLYRDGLIPKTYQDFESALAGYSSGRTDALTVINRLKALVDFELLYWAQFAEREKALARIEAALGVQTAAGEAGGK
jgi:outer membrane protein TolC